MHPIQPIELDLSDPSLRQRLRDQALAEAEALRRAALDDLWRGANAALGTAATAAQRSARRLASRLARRRAAAEPAFSPCCAAPPTAR